MTARTLQSDPLLVLLGGPAGSGKSTLAQAWCENRTRSAHIDLDKVRHMIAGGFADPQIEGTEQSAQFELAAKQCSSLARNFLQDGFDTVVESVFQPDEYQATWNSLLEGLNPIIIVLLPDLETALQRSTFRTKDVLEIHTRTQHASCSTWPQENRLDTTGHSLAESLRAFDAKICSLAKVD